MTRRSVTNFRCFPGELAKEKSGRFPKSGSASWKHQNSSFLVMMPQTKAILSATCRKMNSMRIENGTVSTRTSGSRNYSHGVHLTTVCGKDGFRHRTHDSIIHSITTLTRFCGIMTKKEEFRCFQEGIGTLIYLAQHGLMVQSVHPFFFF